MGEQKENKNDLVKNGIIGFFDILGYGSLLENNEPEDIYNIIFPVLDNLKNDVPKEMKIILKRKGEEINVKHKFQPLIDSIYMLVFSDTILTTLNTDIYSSQEKWLCWSIFLPFCSILQKNMFQKGLPLRGVINYGKYIVQRDFFAGKPIVDAYQVSKELDLSACVMTSTASNVYYKDIGVVEKSKPLRCALDPFLNYSVPRKKNKRSRMNTLCTIVENCEENGIRSIILESFGAHNKEITDSENSKVDNTEEWLKYRKRNFDTKVDELKQKLNK